MKSAPHTSGPIGAIALSAAVPILPRKTGTRSTPPPGWSTAWRLKHGGPSGLIPRSRRTVTAKEATCS